MSETGPTPDFNPQPDPPGDKASEAAYPPGPSAYPPGPTAFPPGPSAFPPGPTATGDEDEDDEAQVPTDTGVIVPQAE